MSLHCFGGKGRRDSNMPSHFTELKKYWDTAYKEEKIAACSNTDAIVKRMFQLQAALGAVEELKKKYTCAAWKDAPKALTPCEMMHAIREKYAALEENTIAARSFFHQESNFRREMEKYEKEIYGRESARTLGELKERRAKLDDHLNRLLRLQDTIDPWIVANIEDRLNPVALRNALGEKIEYIDEMIGCKSTKRRRP